MTTDITIFGIDLFYILCGLAGVCTPGTAFNCSIAGEDQQVKKEVPHVYEGGKWKVP